MAGPRATLCLARRLQLVIDVYGALVKLESRSQVTGMSAPAWHHDGKGVGVRVAAQLAVLPHLDVSLALGESYAETHYDDDMGVAWLSLDLAATGRW